MKMPIIVAEGLDVTIYYSIEDAAANLEAIDVKNGVYKGWDSTGRSLVLTARGKQVVIEDGDLNPTHVAELAGLLARYLEATSSSGPRGGEASLAALINACKSAEYRKPQTLGQRLRHLVLRR